MDRRAFLLAAGTLAVAAQAEPAQNDAPKDQLSAARPSSTEEMPSIELGMAQFAAGVHYESLPTEVVQACKRLLLDALACAFGAVGTAPAKITEATFRKAFGSSGAATIIGNPLKISTEGATLVNGAMIRQLEFNDIYFGKDPAHPSEVIAAAIACCEEAGRSGRDLIEALVVGYELETRLNDAVAWASRGFIASTAAAFVAPAVAGKAWRMPVEQVVHAIGISGSRQLTTLAVSMGEISMMKSVDPGFAGMDAVFSTRLAAAGMTGVTRSIEWLASNVQPRQTNISVDLEPGNFRLLRVGMKRFPLEGDLQALAEAGVNLHAKLEAQTGSIQQIVVEAYPSTVGREVAVPEKYHPPNRLTADHSLPICLAIALLDGDLTVKQFDDDRWKAPEVISLAQKVQVQEGKSLVAQMPEGHGIIVEIRLDNGQILRETVLIPEGDAEKPMSSATVEHKFRQFADPVLGAAGSSQVISYVNHLEDVRDIRAFTTALRKRA